MTRWLIGTFLALHGVTHAFWPSYGSSISWLLGEAGGLAVTLWAAATVLFAVTGLALILRRPFWRPLAVASAVESLVLFGLFGEPGEVVGIAIDAAVLLCLLWVRWPSVRVLQS